MKSGTAKTRILLVDDHTLVRHGFKSLLQEMEGLEVAGEAADGRSAIESALELKPDVILMDLRLPDMSGVDATRHILAELPGSRIVALTVYSEHQFVAGMLEAGASGYLLKDCATEELQEAIREVSEGRKYLGKTVAAEIAERYASGLPASPPDLSLLTKREVEILTLFAESNTVKEVAAHLGLNIHTVYTHRKNIMKKLDLATNAELMRFTIRKGLTPF